MSRSAATLVEAVEQVGGHLVSEGGRLKVSAPKPLPAELLEDLRDNKAALISYLNVAPDEPPAEWAAAVARLQRTECPWGVTPERWHQVLSDATRLLGWAAILEAMEWTTQDVFGRDDSDHQSLVRKVKGQRISHVGEVAAVLRGANGETEWVYRRGAE